MFIGGGFLDRVEKNERMNDSENEFDTLAGYILHELERIPHTGDSLEWKDFKIEVIDMDGHRIDKVLVTPSQEVLDEMDE